MTRKVTLLLLTLCGASCAHTMSDQPNTADVSRPFERSNDPIQATVGMDVNDDGTIAAHRNEPPKPDAGAPAVVDTVVPH